MTTAGIVELTRSDLAQLKALLRAQRLPDDDCGEAGRYFCGIFDGGELIAAGGLETAAPYALLRSVAVQPAYRARGLARRITDHLLARASREGRLAVYLLTETAEKYFASLGFDTVERSDVPAEIRRTQQFSTLCPQSASCMRRLLPPGRATA